MESPPHRRIVFRCVVPDRLNSFNMDRQTWYADDRLRKTVLLFNQNPFFIPGIQPKDESTLFGEIKNVQNMKSIDQFSFLLDDHLFSFPWRFRNFEGFSYLHGSIKPLPFRLSRDILKKEKSFRNHLRSCLCEGQVYLIPDREVSFNQPGRQAKLYLRRVLVLLQPAETLLLIPISTQIDRLSEEIDILINPFSKGKSDLDSTPAIERFPYQIFSKKSYLCIQAAKTIGKDEFLDIAIQPMGVVRRELTKTVREQLKKIALFPFTSNRKVES